MSSLTCPAMRMRPSSQARRNRLPGGLSDVVADLSQRPAWPLDTTGAAIWNTCIWPGQTRTSTGTPAAASMCAALRASLSSTSDPDTWISVRGKAGLDVVERLENLLGLAVDDIALGGRFDQLDQRGETPSAGTSRRCGCSDGWRGSRCRSRTAATWSQWPQAFHPPDPPAAAARPAPAPGTRPPSRRRARSGRARSPSGAATCRRRSSRRAPCRRSASGSSGS